MTEISTQEEKMYVEITLRLLFLRNEDQKIVKTETEKINYFLTDISVNYITKLNDLI